MAKTVISEMGVNDSLIYAQMQQQLEDGYFSNATKVTNQVSVDTLEPSFLQKFEGLFGRTSARSNFAMFARPPRPFDPSAGIFSYQGLVPRIGSEDTLANLLQKTEEAMRMPITPPTQTSADWEPTKFTALKDEEAKILMKSFQKLIETSKLLVDINVRRELQKKG